MRRKDVTKIRKLEYLVLALREFEINPDVKFKTDVIGIAMQFSTSPKLKREDFDEVLNMTISDFANKFPNNSLK